MQPFNGILILQVYYSLINNALYKFCYIKIKLMKLGGYQTAFWQIEITSLAQYMVKVMNLFWTLVIPQYVPLEKSWIF